MTDQTRLDLDALRDAIRFEIADYLPDYPDHGRTLEACTDRVMACVLQASEGSTDQIPERHVEAQQILDWHHTLATGGSLRFGDDKYVNSVQLAIVRWMNGLGADPSSAHGEQAMANVVGVLA